MNPLSFEMASLALAAFPSATTQGQRRAAGHRGKGRRSLNQLTECPNPPSTYQTGGRFALTLSLFDLMAREGKG